MKNSAALLILALVGSSVAQAHIVPFAANNMPVGTFNGATTVYQLFPNDTQAVVVTSHVPDPFEISLSMSGQSGVEITDNIPGTTMIGAGLFYSSVDRSVWCMGTEQYCTPTYNGNAYYGIRFSQEDGIHYGWVETNFTNYGWGIVSLSVVGGAYQDQPNMALPAGAIDIVLPDGCGSADYNHDGDVGTDQDITDFFSCLSGLCCETCGSIDFNGDGDPGTDEDINAFFRVLGGGNC
jgi:hypothetical protein